jgi:hypothetical protein
MYSRPSSSTNQISICRGSPVFRPSSRQTAHSSEDNYAEADQSSEDEINRDEIVEEPGENQNQNPEENRKQRSKVKDHAQPPLPRTYLELGLPRKNPRTGELGLGQP